LRLILQLTAATSASATKIPPRKRGRPKTKVEDQTPKPKLLEKLQAATLNEEASEPAVYASTTKGESESWLEAKILLHDNQANSRSIRRRCQANLQWSPVQVLVPQGGLFRVSVLLP